MDWLGFATEIIKGMLTGQRHVCSLSLENYQALNYSQVCKTNII